jgi:hypothetical protein
MTDQPRKYVAGTRGRPFEPGPWPASHCGFVWSGCFLREETDQLNLNYRSLKPLPQGH